jgi:hypothetical protein
MAETRETAGFTSPSSRLASLLLRRIRGAAKKERWGRSFLQIAWTAGPVTYLGLQSGYYIAYGSAAPPASFMYFAGYTLVAGVFALVARFIYNATRGDAKSAEIAALEYVFDALPQRIIEIRNLQLSMLDPYGRRVLGAKYLLENPMAGPDAMATAVWDVLGDQELFEGVRRLEIYRSNGLHSRARETSEALRPLLVPHEETLRSVSDSVATMLLSRFNEDQHDPRVGRVRTRGFLSRCYNAADRDDINLMTLADAEEIGILIFEIINGRSFPWYRTEYRGHHRYTDAARALQKAQSEYRAALYRRNDAIRVLAERLYTPYRNPANRGPAALFRPGKKRGPGIHRVLASIPEIRSARLLQERIVEAMVQLITGPDSNSSLARECTQMYKRLHRLGSAAVQAHAGFRSAWERMDKLLSSDESWNPKTIRLLKDSQSGTGVALVPSDIVLGDRQIMPFARQIHDKLREFDHRHEDRVIRMNDEKELAIDLLLIADDFLPLESGPIQRAIEQTQSAYISRSARQRTGSDGSLWGLAPVQGHADPGRDSAHEILRNLILFEGLRLDEDDVAYCAEAYGADPEFLSALSGQAAEEDDTGFTVDVPHAVPSLEEVRGKY